MENTPIKIEVEQFNTEDIQDMQFPICVECQHFGISHPSIHEVPQERLGQFIAANLLSYGVCRRTAHKNLVDGSVDYRLATYARLNDTIQGSCGPEGKHYKPIQKITPSTNPTTDPNQ